MCNVKSLKLVRNCKTLFLKTCGDNECVIKLKKQSNFKKYGHVCAIHGIEQSKNIKKKLNEMYGVENVSQIDWVKQKKIKTCKKNFGVNYPMQSVEVMAKSKKTLKRLYGVDNISKMPEIIEKIRKSLFEIDPLLGMSKFKFSILKQKEINIKKYGVPYYVQTDEFKNKSKLTCLKKYNETNYSKTKEFKDFLLKSGLKRSPESLSKLQTYYREVKKYTKISYNLHKKFLSENYKRSTNYHLDHIYSIIDGFRNNIDPKIIGSICNLQLIPSTINLQKNEESWISLEKLINLYNDLPTEDKNLVII